MTTFLWADCHTHGPHKSTHLYSYFVVGLVDESKTMWAYSGNNFPLGQLPHQGSPKNCITYIKFPTPDTI